MSVCSGTLSCLSSFNFVLSFCHDIENVRRHTPGSGDVALRRHGSDARRVDQQRGSERGGSQKGLSEEKLQGKDITVKTSNSRQARAMFDGEFESPKATKATGIVRVPTPHIVVDDPTGGIPGHAQFESAHANAREAAGRVQNLNSKSHIIPHPHVEGF